MESKGCKRLASAFSFTVLSFCFENNLWRQMLASRLGWVQQCWRKSLSVAALTTQALPKVGRPTFSSQGAVERSAVDCVALADDSLPVLQEKNKQLRTKLAAIPWPSLTSFNISGKGYTLPFKPQHKGSNANLAKPSAKQCSYLAGFFDGDGSVYAFGNKHGLRVTQSIDGAEALMHLQQALGGSILRQRDGLGLQKPCLVWMLCNTRARYVAGLLAPHSIVKRRQLEILAGWPRERTDRAECVRKLSALKRADSSMAGQCTWAYSAGFFDAEGYIYQRGRDAYLQLKIAQKHITVLERLQAFFATETGFRPSVVQSSRGFDLRISTTSTCKFILQQMLDAGMLRKAAQARLALSLTSENAEEVRSKMAGMVGNQGFGRRLDGAGVRRASAIKLTQGLVKRVEMKGQDSLAQSIREDVEKQKHEHALLNARRVNHELHAYIDKIHALHQDPNSGDYQPFTPFPEHQAETSI